VKSLLIATALVVSALAPHTPAHAGAQVVGGADSELRMEVGKGRLMRLSHPATTMFIADPKIADVQVKSPTLVYVIGKAPGSTTFFAMDGKEQMVANMAVNVGFDEARLRELLRQQAPNSQVEVTAANGALILTGKVGSPAEGDDVLRIAALFVQGDDKDKPGQIINRLTIDTPTEVYLSVRIAEVSRQANSLLGFNWQSMARLGHAGGFLGWATGAQILPADGSSRTITRPAGDFGSIVGGIYNPAKGQDINVLIDALQEKNLVSVLAEPNLTARSGEPAFFLAGGEYPIPVPQAQGQTTIEYKKYGVSLSFVATILNGGRISLNVRPEVSELTSTGAITLGGITVPALTTRQAETTVDLASGQSFAIAGLMQHTANQDLKKMPAIGDIPILGQLFRSKNFQHNESELVIIVTPYLVKPTSRRLAAPTDPPPLAAPPAHAEAQAAPPPAVEKKG